MVAGGQGAHDFPRSFHAFVETWQVLAGAMCTYEGPDVGTALAELPGRYPPQGRWPTSS